MRVLASDMPAEALTTYLRLQRFVSAFNDRMPDRAIGVRRRLRSSGDSGLVVLGGTQQWWLQPLVSRLEPFALFFGALGLTAITDNAALTYLGSLIEGMTDEAKYMLVAGAVAGDGLTVIANAPNPAGVTLLKHGFKDESIGAVELLGGALVPTAIAAALFLL